LSILKTLYIEFHVVDGLHASKQWIIH